MAIATTAIVSLVAKLFASEIGRAQQARFLGAFSGPAVGVVAGAFLFDVLGYFGVFLLFSVVVLLSSFLMYAFDEDVSREMRDNYSAVTYSGILKVRRVLLVVLCGMIQDLLEFSLASSLALKLHNTFDYSTSTIGLFFGFFLIGTVLVGMIGLLFPERWDKRILLIIFFWVNFVAALLIGPSKVLNIPDEPPIIASGLFLGGSIRSFVGAYIIVEGIRGGASHFPDQEVRVGDLMSSLYQTVTGLTSLLSPIFGSSLSKALGFRYTMDIEAAIFLVISLIYSLSTGADLKKEREERHYDRAYIPGEEASEIVPLKAQD